MICHFIVNLHSKTPLSCLLTENLLYYVNTGVQLYDYKGDQSCNNSLFREYFINFSAEKELISKLPQIWRGIIPKIPWTLIEITLNNNFPRYYKGTINPLTSFYSLGTTAKFPQILKEEIHKILWMLREIIPSFSSFSLSINRRKHPSILSCPPLEERETYTKYYLKIPFNYSKRIP